jgi:hypothetical protein
VRPYLKSNKNDSIDAEAIAEAVLRPDADQGGYGVQLLDWSTSRIADNAWQVTGKEH